MAGPAVAGPSLVTAEVGQALAAVAPMAEAVERESWTIELNMAHVLFGMRGTQGQRARAQAEQVLRALDRRRYPELAAETLTCWAAWPIASMTAIRPCSWCARPGHLSGLWQSRRRGGGPGQPGRAGRRPPGHRRRLQPFLAEPGAARGAGRQPGHCHLVQQPGPAGAQSRALHGSHPTVGTRGQRPATPRPRRCWPNACPTWARPRRWTASTRPRWLHLTRPKPWARTAA